MGIQIMAVTLAMVGVLTGSAFGGTVSAAPANAPETPKVECVCPGDCEQDQLKIQDCSYAGDQMQDRDQLRTQDCLQTCDGAQDQLRTQDSLQDGTSTQDQVQAGK